MTCPFLSRTSVAVCSAAARQPRRWASPGTEDPGWEDLTIRQPRDPADVLEEARHLLSLDSAHRVRHRPDGPDVTGLAEGLGLR